MKKGGLHHLRRSMKKAKAVLAVVLIVLVHSCIWVWLKSVVPNLEQENGAMENYQAVFLCLGVVLWIWALLRSNVRADKIFFGVLALFTGTILVLEVDFRGMNAPMLNAVMNGRIRDLWLGSLWLAGAFFFLRNAKAVLKSFLSWLRTPSAVMMISGGAFWILSALIDKSLLGRKDLFNEELMEVNATLLMTASGLLHLYRQKRQPKTEYTSEPASQTH